MEHSDLKVTLQVENATRVDKALTEHFQKKGEKWHYALSRNHIKKWFQDKRVLLDDHPVNASHMLEHGNHFVKVLKWDPDELHPPEAAASPRGCFLPVVHEDDHILVLHKAAGIPSAPLPSSHKDNAENTAVSAALAHFPKLKEIESHSTLEPGLLHRLDTATSGLIAFAKDQSTFDDLSKKWGSKPSQFPITKLYRAVVSVENGDPKPQKIIAPLGHCHSSKSSKKMIALNNPPNEHDLKKIRGNPLEASTEIIEVKKIKIESKEYWDLLIQIHSGVMHQIRCHLSHLGFPVLGDVIYGKTSPSSRLWLHAWKLTIPMHEKLEINVEADLPPHWGSII